MSDVAGFPRSEIEQPIPARFARVAAAFPDRTAVRTRGVSVSYAQLHRDSRSVGRSLRTLGGDRARPVALLMEAGAPLFASMLGALEAGRFYAPIDPSLGEARAREILLEVDADTIVTDAAGRDLLGRVRGRGARVVDVEELLRVGSRNPVPATEVSAGDLAYVLFTSGSTGAARGVLQSHRNVLHNAFKLSRGLHLTPDDRLTLLSSCSLGASVSDIYGALLNGASVHPWPLAAGGLLGLAALVERERITVLHCAPSVFRRFAAMLDGTENLSSLRLVKLGGEPVLSSDLELHRRRLPRDCVFHVGFGATEINVIRQWFADRQTPCPWTTAPVGYAVDDTEVVLLDEQGRPTAADTGEIAVVSPTLAVGYWRRPDATAAAFAPVPGRAGWRMYRTGDLGRLLPNGCLLHLGRLDSCVKVRGQRVELLQVEAALAGLPGIREAAAAAREGPGGNRLVAYFVSDAAQPPRVSQLRAALASRLPAPMVPSAFVRIDSLPATFAGKLDREALPAPGRNRPELETSFVPPTGDTEETIARIFSEVLELDAVGARDDFFDLGGDSLLAVETMLALERELGRAISPESFLEDPTPEGLARRVAAAGPPGHPRLVTLRAGPAERIAFLVPGGAGGAEELLVNARLARRVGGETRVVALPAGAIRRLSIREETSEYVRRIRSAQSAGPYILIGECIGGILAFAIARRLVLEGERVSLLALLDTPFPTGRRRLLHWMRGAREPWGDNLVRRVRHHGRSLAKLPSGRIRYLLARARSLLRGVGSLFSEERRGIARSRAARVGRLLAWRPERFEGTLSLVESAEGRHDGIGIRWAAVAAATRVVCVPGDHHTYIREHVDAVAAALRQWLEETVDGEAVSPAGEVPEASATHAEPATGSGAP